MSYHHWTDALLQDITTDIRSLTSNSVYVGYSGGLDSTLLLWCAVQALGAERVTAIHVNHGLSVQADEWIYHCQQQCQRFGCQLLVRQVEVINHGKGVEAEARQQRYQVFADTVPQDAVLLLGHHQDDQVETFFLRLMRGAGPHGLQGIPKSHIRDGYRLHRPLLELPRSTLFEFATEQSLNWIEDDSNEDSRFDRNFLRQQVLPLIETRWSGYRDRIVKTQQLLSEPALHETAEATDMTQELAHRLSHDGGLKMVQLSTLTQAQQLSLLHGWLVKSGQQVPSSRRLQAILDDVVQASGDAQPQVALGAGSVRRHGPALYWVPDLPDPTEPPVFELDTEATWLGIGRVMAYRCDNEQPRLSLDLPNLHWRLRCGGEVMQPFGRAKSRDLKRLLQEYRIKPWLRDRIPLLYSGDILVAVGDELLSARHLAGDGEHGIRISWQKQENAD